MKLYRFMGIAEYNQYNSGEIIPGPAFFLPVFRLEREFQNFNYDAEVTPESLKFAEESNSELIVEFETIGFEPHLEKRSFYYEKDGELDCIYDGYIYIAKDYSKSTMYATKFAWNNHGEPEKWYILCEGVARME